MTMRIVRKRLSKRMETNIGADSQFQAFLKDFRTAFGIEHPSQIITEQREILYTSIRMDAVVTFPDDFDFTKLSGHIFPWLGKMNVFEFKGKNDRLQMGQYYQYAFVELGLMIAFCLSNERKDRAGRQWMSQKGIRAYWNKLKSQGASLMCSTIILSTNDPRKLRDSLELKPVNQYPHLQGALYRKILATNKLAGSAAVYLVALNKLKVCPINAPLLLLSKGKKQKEFCQWLLTDAEGLTLEEQLAYKTYLVVYNLIEYEDVKNEMRRNIWKLDSNEAMKLIQEYPGGVEAFIQSAFHVSSPEEALVKMVKTEEQYRRVIQLLQQNRREKERE